MPMVSSLKSQFYEECAMLRSSGVVLTGLGWFALL